MVEAFSAVVLFAVVFAVPMVVFPLATAPFLGAFEAPHFEEKV